MTSPHTPPTALIVQGGWDGHYPADLAALCKQWLEEAGFKVTVRKTLDAFTDTDLESLSLIVPIWTMGEITPEQRDAVANAIESGVGLAGCHGGMCDAFRNDPGWQFLTGGQWVAHPGNDLVRFKVNVGQSAGHEDHWITKDVSNFQVESEQYYLHVDPAVKVLASTIVPPPEMVDTKENRKKFPALFGPHVTNGSVNMPVVWIKLWGKGRVFYNALGHHPDILQLTESKQMMTRGMLWASMCDNLY